MDACLDGLCGATDRTPPRMPRDMEFAPDFTAARRLFEQLRAELVPMGCDGYDLREDIPEAIGRAALACWERHRDAGGRPAGDDLLLALFATWDGEGRLADRPAWLSTVLARCCGGIISRDNPLRPLIWWLIRKAEGLDHAHLARLILDALETSFALVPHEARRAPLSEKSAWRNCWNYDAFAWLQVAKDALAAMSEAWQPQDLARLYGLLRFHEEPDGVGDAESSRERPALPFALACHAGGGSTDADLWDVLLHGDDGRMYQLEKVLGPLPSPEPWVGHPRIQAFAERISTGLRQREEIGSLRGERLVHIAVSDHRREWDQPERLAHCLSRVDPAIFAAGEGHDYEDWRHAYQSALVYAGCPGAASAGAFAAACRRRSIDRRAILALALRNPRLAPWCEAAAAAPGLAAVVAFVAAHAGFNAELFADAANIGLADIRRGVLDLAWFERILAEHRERWEELHPHLGIGGGDKAARLKLCCDARQGRITAAALEKSMLTHRKQAAVVAYGLLPLPDSDQEAALVARVRMLRRFLDTQRTRKMGSERKGNERLVYAAALQNLANLAGGRQPDMLEWLVETAEAAELRSTPAVRLDTLELRLGFDGGGRPQLACTRAGRPLKAIPAAMKASSDGKALIALHKDLVGRIPRFRNALEQALITRCVWTGAQLQDLCRHPMLAPMLQRLVWSGPHAVGWLDRDGAALRTLDGSLEPVGRTDALVLVHPMQLFQDVTLAQWQHVCFVSETMQPIRQLFREIYLLTDGERASGLVSRFDGITVSGRRAWGILGNRGWMDDEGALTKRSRHGEVTICFDEYSETPWEIEELTVLEVHTTAPAVAADLHWYSEALRDIDLAVSVGIAGGGRDSAQIIELRRRLVEETALALGCGNVRCDERHALVQGARSSYRIHLGSGVVHLPDGRQLALQVADDGAGIFLPFTDRDGVAERIIATVLLLADDAAISDPGILAQLGGA